MPFSRIALAVCALLLVYRPAEAQMVPLTDDRSIDAKVIYDGRSDHQAKTPPSPFAIWFDLAVANVTGTVEGSGTANTTQTSYISPSSFNISGATSGSWNVHPADHYDAKSHLKWKFRVSQCITYSLFAQADPGVPMDGAYVDVRGPGGTLYHFAHDTTNVSGRLAAGDYEVEAESAVWSSVQNGSGGGFNAIWQCSVCPASLITTHPTDRIVRCDTIATFCVVPNGAVGSFTYQWRRNYVPLTNTAHYTGVNTACFSVQHACWPDTANYDVLVTSGSTTEPSRAAHLGISGGTVGVAPPVYASWSLGVATPSPSRGSSSLRYSAPAPFHARVTVQDVAGRVVRRLADRVLEASGTVVWDGSTTAGLQADPGIYFLRLERDGAVDVRRVVRLQ